MSVRRLIVFAMLGSLMFASTWAMKGLPNVHLLALFIIVCTRVYRVQALIPLYVYVFLEGLYQGFSLWWIPYLYIWAVLWAIAMPVPKNLDPRLSGPLYCVIGALHGLAFGAMWAPSQMVLFHLPLRALPAWIMSGLPFDVTHCISNAVVCTLVLPLSNLLLRLENGNR